MAVQPNSTIRLLSNVPLTLSGENTIYFSSKAAQSSYFIGKTVETFNNNSYQRVNSGTIRVECLSDTVQNCNYLMFINSNHGAKWFYAFITDIRYINEHATEIDYVLDDLQTYFFDIELKECYVEREHTETDVAGDNTIPEDIPEPAMRYTNTKHHTGLFDSYTVVTIGAIYPHDDGTWTTLSPQCDLITGIPMGLRAKYLKNVADDDNPKQYIRNAITHLKTDLRDIDWVWTTDLNELASIYAIPTSFVSVTPFNISDTSQYGDLPSGLVSTTYRVASNKPTALGSYIPKNKKLLTYPFNKLVCNTFDDWKEYRYEWFTGEEINFAIYASLAPPISFKAAPKLYYGDDINDMFATVLEGFPTLPYAGTGLMEWITKTGTKLAIQGFSVASGYGAITAAGQDLIDFGSAKKSIAETPAQQLNAQRYIVKGQNLKSSALDSSLGEISNSLLNVALNTPTPSAGTSSSGNIEFATDEKDFFFFQVYPKEEYSEIIDNFFHLYGYAVKKIKVPNIHVRKGWTYTKTANAMIVGGAPATALQNITNRFNSGIRFWNDGDNIGNYSSNNRPLVEP